MSEADYKAYIVKLEDEVLRLTAKLAEIEKCVAQNGTT
jgi:hypothetical protein